MNERRCVLAVDDNPGDLRLLRAYFETAVDEFELFSAETAEKAYALIESHRPDLVLLDLCIPGVTGLEALKRIHKIAPGLPVIYLTGYADIRTAVEATQLGAAQFLAKPVNCDELLHTVRIVTGIGTAARKLPRASLAGIHQSAWARLANLGSDDWSVLRKTRQVAPTGYSVLIEGETGVGKELVAIALHELSPRSVRPFLVVDCGALPEQLIESELFGHEKGAFAGADRRKEGLFVAARGGTLFLDEIANLTPAIQMKLLRVMQERKIRPLGAREMIDIDVRFVAATNVSLKSEIGAGRFREDFYHRIAEYTIEVEPLRQRRHMILPLAQWFLQIAAVELSKPVASIHPDARELLHDSDWLGNCREVRNVIRRGVLQSEGTVLMPSDIQDFLRASDSDTNGVQETNSLHEIARASRENAEREAISRTLAESRGNKAETARRLGIDYRTLHRKLHRLGIKI